MTTSQVTTTSPVAPRPRNRKFQLAERTTRDYAGDAFTSHFLDALSMAFPRGEKFFVDSVRGEQKKLGDAKLLRDVAAFVVQESLHSREHEKWNAWIASRGGTTQAIDDVVAFLLGVAERLPKPLPLAATCSLEHATATLAEYLLTNEELRGRMDEEPLALLTWHALEEIEHKGVAFDVYRAVGGNEAVRIGSHVVVTGILLVAIFGFTFERMRTDGRRHGLGAYVRGVRDFLGTNGHLRRLAPQWAEYLRPGFHPWDRDQRPLLTEWIARTEAPAMATA